MNGLTSVAGIRSRLPRRRSQPEGERIEALLQRLCAAVEGLLTLERERLSRWHGRFAAEDSPAAGGALPHHLEPIPELALTSLSPAERSLLGSVREGLSNKEIAARRETSVKTVKGQLTGVYKKLRVAGRGKLLARLR